METITFDWFTCLPTDNHQFSILVGEQVWFAARV